jgi:RNA-directed DNA polymerase
MEDGVVTVSDRGTWQGSVISSLLANIYLHYTLDLWALRWRRREATGDMIFVRYADDFEVESEVPGQVSTTRSSRSVTSTNGWFGRT